MTVKQVEKAIENKTKQHYTLIQHTEESFPRRLQKL